MQISKQCLMGMLLFSSCLSQAATQESKPETLLYISPLEYNHSVRLLSPYYDYWFEQGPLVEPIALKALKNQADAVNLCKANETADTIIRLKPRIFYNPQMRVYHSKLEATVYSGNGEIIGQYAGEAQQQGFASFDNATKYHLKKVYGLAMKDLMSKISLQPTVQSNESTNPSQAANPPTGVQPGKSVSLAKLPCSLIGAQTEPVFNFY